MIHSFKKFLTYSLVSAVLLSATNTHTFFDNWFVSHKMSKLSLTAQKDGFLLNDVLFNAQRAVTAVTNKDQAQFNRLIGPKDHFELLYILYHCFDLSLNHGENKDILVKDLAILVDAFNQAIEPVNAHNIVTLNIAQINALQKAFDDLSAFIKKYGISSANTREIIKELQKDANANDKPVQSIFRTEYILPAIAITAVIGGIFVWNKWLSAKFWQWWHSAPPLLSKDIKMETLPVKVKN